MSIALGLTGVPTLSPTGKVLDSSLDQEVDFDMHQTYMPPPPYTLESKMPLHALPLTPDASPADWDKQEYSRSSTPVGHVSATHPPGAPLYGLGFPPSMFEESLQTITVSAPRPPYHDVVSGLPTPQMTPALALPPFNKSRPNRSSIVLPKSEEHFHLFSPGIPTQPNLRRRRRRALLYRRIVWIVFFGLVVLVTCAKIARASWLSNWMKHNAQWSPHVHQLEDSIYGLEEDFTPRYFHRTQRQQYVQYMTQGAEPNAETEIRTFDEVETHVFAEDDLRENQDSFFTASAPDVEAAAISDRIDDLLSSPEVSAFMSGQVGDLRSVYHEAVSASPVGLDSAMNLDGPQTVSLLRQADNNRRQFLKTMVRYLVKGGKLPSHWHTETSFETLMHQIWTTSSDQTFEPLLFEPQTVDLEDALFADGWQEQVADVAGVTVFTKVSRARSAGEISN